MVGQSARIHGLPFTDDLFSFVQGGLDVAFTVESAVDSGTHGSNKNLKEQEPTMNTPASPRKRKPMSAKPRRIHGIKLDEHDNEIIHDDRTQEEES